MSGYAIIVAKVSPWGFSRHRFQPANGRHSCIGASDQAARNRARVSPCASCNGKGQPVKYFPDSAAGVTLSAAAFFLD
ncbi:hypothetical protein GCM10010201_33160 [Pilimelia columellifera subsp. columellifera]|uniref:Uncharacterized protein n=1 Tax=Pilimelia columellifera subsp. columellifera TaxID=706583 RepID=A0ABN3NRV2_9ACTN